jgi:hypothetical protein
MATTCKNCGRSFEGDFCNQCGQSAATRRLNARFLRQDIQQGLLNFDNGIFYTARQLFTRPGHTIREYIEGKRANHYKPISLVLVLAGVLALLSHFPGVHAMEMVKNIDLNPDNIFIRYNQWIETHQSLVELINLLLFTVCTFLAFRKRGYNFIEHLVLNAFITGQRLIIDIAFFPLQYLGDRTSSASLYFTVISAIQAAAWFWVLFQFFNTQPKVRTFFLTLLACLYYLVILFVASAAYYIIT